MKNDDIYIKFNKCKNNFIKIFICNNYKVEFYTLYLHNSSILIKVLSPLTFTLQYFDKKHTICIKNVLNTDINTINELIEYIIN